MATTTLMPVDPALNPQRMARILTISADLLPAEIVSARRARRSRGWIAGVLVLVVALLGGWYAYAAREVRSADAELSDVTSQATTLQKSQTKYQEVVDVQNETSTISKELKTLMANDLQWSNLLDTLRSTGTGAGVKVLGVNALLNQPNVTPNAADALPSSTDAGSIGSVTITGSAPNKPSVARYVAALGKLTVVANPYLTSATATDSGDRSWQYSITVDITETTLCGRFTTPCKTGGN
jgi:Tfp pilus assembly protein PilN